MKTIIITVKTDQLNDNKNLLVHIDNNSYKNTHDTYAELKAKDSIANAYADNSTVFGSSMKDEFMYHLAISG
jgi:hypothetical protein